VTETALFEFYEGTTPLLVSVPHAGTYLPPAIASRMTEAGRAMPDTDWFVHHLYAFARDLGASFLVANWSRYVVDLNRPPDSAPLYPGAANTGLCPTEQFDGAPIYRPGETPGDAEIDERRTLFWRPYHDRLAAELQALRERHGTVLLYEAHSIRSRVPRLFDGRLPDINLGTADGAAAAADLAALLVETAGEAESYSSVLNGRFKGGYITRRYGRPAERIHAVQLELSQLTYMEEDAPFRFRDDLAAAVRPTLRAILQAMLAWART
jgi:N-formylglutamate deformylase